MNESKNDAKTNSSWFNPLILIVFLILVWGVTADVIDSSSKPEFKYDFFNSSIGLMIRIEPLQGKHFPEGDVVIHIYPERRSGGRIKSFFDGSFKTMSPKDDFKFGGYWLKCPHASHIIVSVKEMGTYSEVKVPTGVGLQRVPWEHPPSKGVPVRVPFKIPSLAK